MANFYGTARTNYFKVKSPEKFKEYVDTIPGAILISKKEDRATLYGYYMDNEYGTFPSSGRYADDDEEYDIDVVDDIVAYLAEGSVAVFMDCGAEKCRYLTGCAIAIDSKGESVMINLSDIYKMAEQQLGILPTRAEY